MRTTLAIDDDVLAAARGLAAQQHKSVGAIISSLARQALRPVESEGGMRNGIPLLPVRSGTSPVTAELIKELHADFP